MAAEEIVVIDPVGVRLTPGTDLGDGEKVTEIREDDEGGSPTLVTNCDTWLTRPRNYGQEGPCGPYVWVCDDVTTTQGRIERLEVEVRMLRGSLGALTGADEVSSPSKMAAIAKVALKESRKRITLTDSVEARSLISNFDLTLIDPNQPENQSPKRKGTPVAATPEGEQS